MMGTSSACVSDPTLREGERDMGLENIKIEAIVVYRLEGTYWAHRTRHDKVYLS